MWRWIGICVVTLCLVGAGGEPVKIGLIVPAANSPESQAMQEGATLALQQANRKGGYHGRPFELVVRAEEGVWGVASRRISQIVFEDKAVAVLGSADGLSAHLVEQIVTKGKTPFVSPWASDPTLSQGKIPWFFRSVPDDRIQSDVLVREIFGRRKLRRVVIVRQEDYNGRIPAQTFIRAMHRAGLPPPGTFIIGPGKAGIAGVVEEVRAARPGALVLLANPGTATLVLQQLRARGIEQPVFGTMRLCDPVFLSHAARLGDVTLVEPGVLPAARARFAAEYRRAFGHAPAPLAAYSYDSMVTVLEAVRRGGLDTWKVRDALAATRLESGITGQFRYDASGNRLTGARVASARKIAVDWSAGAVPLSKTASRR